MTRWIKISTDFIPYGRGEDGVARCVCGRDVWLVEGKTVSCPCGRKFSLKGVKQ